MQRCFWLFLNNIAASFVTFAFGRSNCFYRVVTSSPANVLVSYSSSLCTKIDAVTVDSQKVDVKVVSYLAAEFGLQRPNGQEIHPVLR